MTKAEARFVGNLRKARKADGTSQDEVARLMRVRGFRWHQATVWKVEHGARHIYLGEAEALAQIFGYDLDDLLARNFEVIA